MKIISLLTFLSFCLVTCKSPESLPETPKTTGVGIKGKYWKLVELNGHPVLQGENLKEPFLRLHPDTSSMQGNTGCNSFFGTYEAGPGDRLVFSKIGVTEMACNPMKSESGLLQAFRQTDSFAVINDTLVLRQGSLPLARFTYTDIK